ncbi:MAG: helix-turn-helix transcriptional regulator [bacterium]|nr:helix-turn-helix transcriptional regulator [bacterium]
MRAYDLKCFRESRKLTQEQLADRLGVSRTLLNMYENTKRIIPKHIDIHIQDIRRIDELESKLERYDRDIDG